MSRVTLACVSCEAYTEGFIHAPGLSNQLTDVELAPAPPHVTRSCIPQVTAEGGKVARSPFSDVCGNPGPVNLQISPVIASAVDLQNPVFVLGRLSSTVRPVDELPWGAAPQHLCGRRAHNLLPVMRPKDQPWLLAAAMLLNVAVDKLGSLQEVAVSQIPGDLTPRSGRELLGPGQIALC